MQLLQGDCIELMKTLPDKSIDLFLCDLPYGCLTTNTYKGVIDKSNADLGERYGKKIDWDIQINLPEFWKQVERLQKSDHTPIIHFCNTKFGYELIKSKESWFRYDLIWEKTLGVGFLNANKQPLRSHENIYIFAKKGANYYRKDIEGDFEKAGGGRNSNQSVYGNGYKNIQPDNEGKRCIKSVITIPTKRTKGKHPTQKPEELYQFLIERYSKEGDTILDPTAGSFTSVFTANSLNRKAIGIEKDNTFYLNAKSRFETL